MSQKIIVLTAPSGAGKTTIKNLLLANMDELGFAISATTRQKRSSETEGLDYYFKSPEEFKSLIAEEAFIEYEEVYQDHYYGTLKSELERNWAMNKHVVLDIDVQGALNVKKLYGDQCLVIFIKPPSIQTLRNRLKLRDTETLESLQKRISKAESELKYAESFDTFIINDDLDLAIRESADMIRNFIST